MDDEVFARLLNFFESSGVIRDERSRGLLTILRYDDDDLDRPVHLHVTPSSLGRHLRQMEGDAVDVFLETASHRAAWQLFLVHVDEAIRMADGDRTELVLDPSGVRPVTPVELADAPTDEDRRRFSELVDHLARRGDVVADDWRGPITVLEYRGVTASPPLRIDVGPRSLTEHLRESGTGWSSFLAAVAVAIFAGLSGSGSGLVLTRTGLDVET